jgi:hypothetical protein
MGSRCIDPEAGCVSRPEEKVMNASGPLTGHSHHALVECKGA